MSFVKSLMSTPVGSKRSLENQSNDQPQKKPKTNLDQWFLRLIAADNNVPIAKLKEIIPKVIFQEIAEFHCYLPADQRETLANQPFIKHLKRMTREEEGNYAYWHNDTDKKMMMKTINPEWTELLLQARSRRVTKYFRGSDGHFYFTGQTQTGKQ